MQINKSDFETAENFFRKNVSLKKYTTFKIGGRAKYFFEAKNKKDLKFALEFALKNNIPFFILGGGSNLLISDKGYDGLVIKMEDTRYKIQNTKVTAEAGALLGNLVRDSEESGLTGLEWAIGIPGTIGGAVRGNAGAFGKSIGDFVKKVEVLEIKNGRLFSKELSQKECKFSYRESIFKKNRNFIISEVILEFSRNNKREIKEKISEFLSYRKEHQPLNFFSAGSIFKNYEGEISDKKIIRAFPEIRSFNQRKLIPAGYLIDKCRLKGRRKGNIEISKKHANFMVNLGGGRAEDVFYLIELAGSKVKEKFNIVLEREIELLGNFSY